MWLFVVVVVMSLSVIVVFVGAVIVVASAVVNHLIFSVRSVWEQRLSPWSHGAVPHTEQAMCRTGLWVDGAKLDMIRPRERWNRAQQDVLHIQRDDGTVHGEGDFYP